MLTKYCPGLWIGNINELKHLIKKFYKKLI